MTFQMIAPGLLPAAQQDLELLGPSLLAAAAFTPQGDGWAIVTRSGAKRTHGIPAGCDSAIDQLLAGGCTRCADPRVGGAS